MNGSFPAGAGSVFDLMAVLIAHLHHLDKALFQSSDSRRALVDDGAWDRAVDELLMPFPIFGDEERLLSQGIPDAVCAAVQNWEYYNSFPFVFALLLYLDRILHQDAILNSPHLEMSKKAGFSALNSNVEETRVVLFPRVRSINDTDTPSAPEESAPPRHKRWQHEWRAGINQDLTHIFYVWSDELARNGDPYSVRHRVLTNFWLENKNKVRFAVSPILADAKVKTSTSTRDEGSGAQRFFTIDGLENSGRIHSRIRAALLQACKDNVDVLVFPEILGDMELFHPEKNIDSLMDSFLADAEEAGWAAPALIIGPSCWHDGKNELFILDNTGRLVCTQQKQSPFQDQAGALEDLKDPERLVHLLHVPRLGRIAFPICKDFLVESYRELLIKTLHCTFLICPSYSPGQTVFNLSLPLGRPYGCYVVWINSCSARQGKPDKDSIGGISYPMEENLGFLPFKPECGGECGGDCHACLFEFDIGLGPGQEGVYLHPHINPKTDPPPSG